MPERTLCPYCGYPMEWEEEWQCDFCSQCRSRGPRNGDASLRVDPHPNILEKYHKALTVIAKADYRGHRTVESQVAYNVLKECVEYTEECAEHIKECSGRTKECPKEVVPVGTPVPPEYEGKRQCSNEKSPWSECVAGLVFPQFNMPYVLLHGMVGKVLHPADASTMVLFPFCPMCGKAF